MALGFYVNKSEADTVGLSKSMKTTKKLVCFFKTLISKRMFDDLENPMSLDLRRININEESELNWWSKEFKVSKEQLKEAVDSVGTFPGAVKYYLMK